MSKKTKSTASRGITHMKDNRYRIRVKAIDGRTGKTKEVIRVVECDGLRQAMARRDEMTLEIRLGGAEKVERIRLGDYATTWFERRAASLKLSTRLRYAELLDTIRLGTDGLVGIGDVYLDAVTPDDIAEWLAKAARRYSGHTCLSLLRLLRTVTKDAQRALRLPYYACDGVKRPKPVKQYTEEEPNALTAAELRALYDEMRRSEPRWFPLFAVIAFTGLRFCEVAALRWGDVDLESGALRIRRAIYRGVVGEPKTNTGRRLVVLPPEVCGILRELGAGKPDAWIFPSAAGTPLSTGILNEPIARALKRVGVKRRLTTHGLRRTFNSLALQVAPAETVRKVIGHADAAMTLHYLHVDTEQRRQLGEGVFGKVREVEGKWKPEVQDVSAENRDDEKPRLLN